MVSKAKLRKERQTIINQIFELNAQTKPFFELNIRTDNPFTPEEKEAMAKQEDLHQEISKLNEKIGNKILWQRKKI